MPSLPRPRLSDIFRDKHVWSFSLPWLGIIVAQLLIFPVKQKADILDATTREVKLLSDMLAMTAGEGLGEGSLGLVRAAFTWSKQDVNVVYVAILDERDSTIFEYNPLNRQIDRAAALACPGVTAGADVVLAVSPVHTSASVASLGTVILQYSLDRANARIRNQLILSVLVTLVLFAVGLRGVALMKRQSRALEAEADKYRVTFENTGTATVIVEDDTTISLANSKFETLSGYVRTEIEGKKTWTEFTHPDDREGLVSQHLRRPPKEGAAARHTELRFLDRDGSLRHVDVSFEAIPGTTKGIASLLDITERKRAEAEIKKSLEEKELLLREVHHRVKNNLQVIVSLLNLQAQKIADPATRAHFDDSQNRIRAMALVHESLYQTGLFGSVNLLQFTRKLAERLGTFYRVPDVRIEVSGDDFSIGLNQAIPCGLLLNELLTNAFKYAYPAPSTGGTVRARIERRESGAVRITVQDDGVGMSDDIASTKPATLGLLLVSSLTEQLGGTLTVTGGPEKAGTVVVVSFS